MGDGARRARRWFLGFSVATWLPYGVFCVFRPGFVGEAATLGFLSATASTEVRAMYGGLQAAIGMLAIVGLVRRAYEIPVVTMLAFLVGGLATTRTLGVILDGGLSAYTSGALVLEWGSLLIASAILARSPPAADV